MSRARVLEFRHVLGQGEQLGHHATEQRVLPPVDERHQHAFHERGQRLQPRRLRRGLLERPAAATSFRCTASKPSKAIARAAVLSSAMIDAPPPAYKVNRDK